MNAPGPRLKPRARCPSRRPVRQYVDVVGMADGAARGLALVEDLQRLGLVLADGHQRGVHVARLVGTGLDAAALPFELAEQPQ